MDYETGKTFEAVQAKLDYIVAWIQAMESEPKKQAKGNPVHEKKEIEPEPKKEPEELLDQPDDSPEEDLDKKAKEYMEKTPPPDEEKIEKRFEKKMKQRYGPTWRRS